MLFYRGIYSWWKKLQYSNLWNPDRVTQFTFVPSHHRVWVDGAMTRWCDRAMMRCCNNEDAMTWWRWCDTCSTMTIKRRSIAPLLSRHRAHMRCFYWLFDCMGLYAVSAIFQQYVICSGFQVLWLFSLTLPTLKHDWKLQINVILNNLNMNKQV